MFVKGGSGADVGHLKTDANVLAGLRPDSQRYFDYHHAANDTFDAINKRELELGAATMASLVYLSRLFWPLTLQAIEIIYTESLERTSALAFPVMLGLLGHTVVQLIDNIMVGQLGTTAELASSILR